MATSSRWSAARRGRSATPTWLTRWRLGPHHDGQSGGFYVTLDGQSPLDASGLDPISNCTGTVFSGLPATTANADWSRVFPNYTSTATYDICALTYRLAYSDAYSGLPVRSDGTRFTADEGDTVAKYLQYITSSTRGQVNIATQNYAPLPSLIQPTAAAGAGRVN